MNQSVVFVDWEVCLKANENLRFMCHRTSMKNIYLQRQNYGNFNINKDMLLFTILGNGTTEQFPNTQIFAQIQWYH